MSKIAGKTISIPGFIFCRPADKYLEKDFPGIFDGMQFDFGVWSEWSEAGYANVMPHMLTFTVPADFDVVPQQVAMLKAKLAEHDEASRTKRNAILEQLSRLQAITYEAEAA